MRIKLTPCTNCQTLKSLYDQITNSLYLQIKNKWMNQAYNTDICFDSNKFRRLARYKRIVENRIINPDYPCTSVSDQDIITQVTLILK